jgi:hypothetical protein
MKQFGRNSVLVSAVVLLTLSVHSAAAASLPRLRISENKRFFVKEDGSPFLYLADTNWGLLGLTREEADSYLKDRAAKKFTVMQAVVLHGRGLDARNAYGQTVFIDNDTKRPNEAFFQHVDYVVDRAADLGIYMALLPLWGDIFITQGYSLLDKSSAYSYGRFLGGRYRDKPVIWILGGDCYPDGVEDIWRALAAGISEGDGGKNLKTYHPRGLLTSSAWFHREAWLDFNMIQSGHVILNRGYETIASDYALTPAKPVVDGEAGYEGIADSLVDFKPGDKVIGPQDVRRIAYCDIFAGAAGYAYGSHWIWDYYSNRKERASYGIPDVPLQEALARPGGSQLQYLRNLMESRPMLDLVPDQRLVASDPGSTTDRVQACRASDGSYAFVYTASGKPFAVRLRLPGSDLVAGKVIRAYWYDPRRGTAVHIEDFTKPDLDWLTAYLNRVYTPPRDSSLDKPNPYAALLTVENDWVLVLEDASKNFAPPGAKRQ